MKHSILMLSLVASASLFADGPNRAFYLDIHRVSPTFEGHFDGIQDGERITVDMKNDLGLEKDSSKLGLAAEYQGPRFGVEFSVDEQDYKGFNRLNKQITVGGQDYPVSADVTSSLKVTNYTFNWTIRALKFEPAWIGIDLGSRIWAVDLKVDGSEPALDFHASSVQKLPIPIPQIGLSAGFQAFDGRLVARGYYHYLSYKKATYHHVGADVRVFPIKWLGVRAFVDNEGFDVPKGSIKDDLEIKLDRNGAGFGLVLRF